MESRRDRQTATAPLRFSLPSGVGTDKYVHIEIAAVPLLVVRLGPARSRLVSFRDIAEDFSPGLTAEIVSYKQLVL